MQLKVDGGHIDAANINHVPLDELDEALALSGQNYKLIYELTKPTPGDQVLKRGSANDFASGD